MLDRLIFARISTYHSMLDKDVKEAQVPKVQS